MPRIQIYLTDQTISQIDKRALSTGRGVERSDVVEEMLRRYVKIIDTSRAEIKSLFSAAELNLLVNASCGTRYTAETLRSYSFGIEDSIALDHADEAFGVDGAALVKKLQSLTPAQTAALIDQIEQGALANA